ncbi:hypothetical protein AGDE_17085 [Angomonas deanei]|nr:hypothetical protein AGDE_17085 [Angomonas deanei]|eukprot:EPY15530.1 hypothetical protein AGDE_17085 [Angomonas deanei]
MLLLQEYTARQALLESEVLSFVELNLLKLHHTYGTRQLEKYKVWGLNSARQLLSYYHQLRQYEQEVLHHVQGKIATTVREDPNKTAVTAAPADSPVENGGRKKKVVKKTIVVKKVKKSKKENGDDAPGSS